MPPEIDKQLPTSGSADRLFVNHVQCNRGFGIFVLVERFSKDQVDLSLDTFTEFIIAKVLDNPANTITSPLVTTICEMPARELQVEDPHLRYLILVVESPNAYYYIKGWSRPQFFDDHVAEVYEIATALFERPNETPGLGSE